MMRFLLRRTVWLLVVLVVVSALVFVIFNVLPARNDAGFGATSHGPVLARLWHFLERAFVHLDLGYAWDPPRAPVDDMVRAALPATISLMLGAMVLALAVGLPLGALCATRPRSVAARAATFASVLMLCAPVYWLGLVLLRFFEPHIGVVRLPFIGGSGTYEPLTHDPVRWVESLLLPWVALAVPLTGLIIRMLTSSMKETWQEDYVRTSRAKGLSAAAVRRRALKPALPPVITLVGLNVATFVSNVVLVETVFGLPGIGEMARTSMENTDLPVVQGSVLAGAGLVCAGSLLADAAQALLDPRVRLS
jgi:peptide/nickel transport system permease protein